MDRWANTMNNTLSTAIKHEWEGASQSAPPRNKPSGTPATVETENEVMTTPMARPRRSIGNHVAHNGLAQCRQVRHPKIPAAMRATIRLP